METKEIKTTFPGEYVGDWEEDNYPDEDEQFQV